MRMTRWLFFSVIAMFIPFSVFAGVFDLTLDVDDSGNTYTQSFSKFEDLFNQIDTDKIVEHFTTYNEDTSSASAMLNFRGVPIYVNFAASSTKLTLSIPSIGVYEEFTGTDRDDSVDMLTDWYKKDGGSALTALQHALSANTGTDPIAGNPSSLMSRMASMDYDQAVSSDASVELNTAAVSDMSSRDASAVDGTSVTGTGTSATQEGLSPNDTLNANMISVFAKYSNYTVDGVKSREYAIPFAYTIRFNNSKNTLAIRLPMSMIDVDSSKSYNLGLGLALGYYLTDDWKITPALSYGAVGSIDLGSVGQIVSGSVTSLYSFHLGKLTLDMGNMAGYYKTMPLSYGDYSFDPDIHNTVIRNGLNLNIPMTTYTSTELFITDTRYFGSDLFIDQYNEVGFSYGYGKNKIKETEKGLKSYVRRARVGATYLFADKTHGVTGNIGFSF